MYSYNRYRAYIILPQLYFSKTILLFSDSAPKGGKRGDATTDKSKRMVKSMSREEWNGAKELEETSDDMRAKSRLLLSR